MRGSQTLKRTTMNVDTELVARAGEILGTRGTTQTVHQALVVRRDALRSLAGRRFAGMDLATLEDLRRGRLPQDGGDGP